MTAAVYLAEHVSAIVAGGLVTKTAVNIAQSINEPAVGSVLYTDLITPAAEHSGIYVGDSKIVHLDGSGKIESVSPAQFVNRLGGFSTGINITVSCKHGKAIGSEEVAARARSMVGRRWEYNLLANNCHRFTSGCLSGDFENDNTSLLGLKLEADKTIGCKQWRIWMFYATKEAKMIARATEQAQRMANQAAALASLKDTIAENERILKMGAQTRKKIELNQPVGYEKMIKKLDAIVKERHAILVRGYTLLAKVETRKRLSVESDAFKPSETPAAFPAVAPPVPASDSRRRKGKA